MSNIAIMAHPWQFDQLSRIFTFDSEKVNIINYNDTEFMNASHHYDKIFLFVSDAHHDHFMSLAKNIDACDKCISLINAYEFYTKLNCYCPKKINGFDFIRNLVWNDLMPREYYAYGLTLATALALRLKVKTLSAIEFGVFYGRGLLAMSSICQLITEEVGTEFKVFGFDTGKGLPDVGDWRDHPEIWNTGDMVMPDEDNLRSLLGKNCKLIIGDIKDTLRSTLSDIFGESSLGFVSIDVDTYTSTKSCLDVFTHNPESYLPVIPTWVDDSYINILQSIYSGEALAISEFNNTNMRKIERKIIRTTHQRKPWHYTYYFTHIFDHSLRNKKNCYDLYLNHTDY